jgi:dolichol-phosphate mannosyltransferase
VLSLTANLYARWMTGLMLHDCTSGFKCFKREVLESIDLSKVYANGYAFQVEMNYRAARLGYRLGEIPIIFFDRNAGRSKMSSKIAGEAFWHIFKMRVGSYLQPMNFARRSATSLVAVESGSEPT